MVSDAEKCILPNESSKGLFWYLGFLFLSFIVFKLTRSVWRGLYSCFLAEILGAAVDWKKMGSWAVVTGSTDGIGKSYAKALAAKGLNIVLVSRNPEKLKSVAKEIGEKYSVETKTVAIDITDSSEIYDMIEREVENLEVGVLVNNVGMSYRNAEYLTKIEDGEKFAEQLIRANIVSCTRMTQMFLPQMEKRRKGVIINVSSLSALSPVPLLSIYSASKVYVNYFSQGIQEEYRTKGIIIQAVLPGFVSTNMSKMRPSFTTCTPDDFVRWAMKTVGIEDQTFGYPIHKLQGYIQECLCLYLPEHANLTLNHHIVGKIRRRYYKKYGIVDKDTMAFTSKQQ